MVLLAGRRETEKKSADNGRVATDAKSQQNQRNLVTPTACAQKKVALRDRGMARASLWQVLPLCLRRRTGCRAAKRDNCRSISERILVDVE
jgi:hypothetical protein